MLDWRLLVRTVDHMSDGKLPPGEGSFTLLPPQHGVRLYGQSTRRLALMYDKAKVDGLKYYLTDAHTTAEGNSHEKSVSFDELRENLELENSVLYNEVRGTAAQDSVLAVAILEPSDLQELRVEARQHALRWHERLPDITILTYNETTGVIG